MPSSTQQKFLLDFDFHRSHHREKKEEGREEHPHLKIAMMAQNHQVKLTNNNY